MAVAARPRRATEIFMFSDRALVVKLFVAYSTTRVSTSVVSSLVGAGGISNGGNVLLA